MKNNIISYDDKFYIELDLVLANANKSIIGETHTFRNNSTCIKYKLNQLLLMKSGNRLALNKNGCLSINTDADEIIPKDVYVVSNENIKKDDWYIDIFDNTLHQALSDIPQISVFYKYARKIVVTTNTVLGLPVVSLQFLEKLLEKFKTNNFSKVYVEVNKNWINSKGEIGNSFTDVALYEESIKDYDATIIYTPVLDSNIATIVWDDSFIKVANPNIEYVCKNCGERYPYKPMFCNDCGYAFDINTFDMVVDGVKQYFTAKELSIFRDSSERNHLKFIYNRLINVYGDNPNMDYMIKLKSLSDWIDNNLK